MGDIEPDILKAINQGLNLHIKAYKPENPWAAIKRQLKESLERVIVAMIILMSLIIIGILATRDNSNEKKVNKLTQSNKELREDNSELRQANERLIFTGDSLQREIDRWEGQYKAMEAIAEKRRDTISDLNSDIIQRDIFNNQSADILMREVDDRIAQLQGLKQIMLEHRKAYENLSIESPTPAPGSP